MTGFSAAAPHAIEHALPWGPVMRGMRWGQGHNRVLFLHESGADIDAWGALPSQVARGLEVATVALDLLGHGLSDDPWEPDRLGEVIKSIVERDDTADKILVVAAGNSALAMLEHAAEQDFAGLVCLSLPLSTSDDSPARSPRVPKLFFAGSAAGDDVAVARRLAASLGGWSVVTAVPVDVRGTTLLRSQWAPRIVEGTVAFLRDCLYPQRPASSPMAMTSDDRRRNHGVLKPGSPFPGPT